MNGMLGEMEERLNRELLKLRAARDSDKAQHQQEMSRIED